MLKVIASPKKAVFFLLIVMAIWIFLGLFFPGGRLVAISLQTGLFDPIPLLHRSVNLVLLPVLDASFQKISTNARHYEGAWLIGAIFLTAIFLNMRVPRFYCRFICPLGALLGVLGRFALWKIGKTESECSNCMLCEANCEGACEPSGEIRISE
jgi:polyferredoxin